MYDTNTINFELVRVLAEGGEARWCQITDTNAKRTGHVTYSREVDWGHGGVKSLLLPLLTIPLLMFPPASLVFLSLASLVIDIRHPCPPINVVGCNEILIFDRVGEFLHILQRDTSSIAFPAWGRDDTFETRGCLPDFCALIQMSRDKDDGLF
jgi:hypothetical protein